MKCPYCGRDNDKVIESRTSSDSTSIRRRRECLSCGGRFTSYERIERGVLMVIKRDGRREEYNREKVLNGILKACEKRPVSMDTIDALIDDIEKILYAEGSKEIKTERIGELIMERLHKIDQVAYVRFASVYRQFKDVSEFVKEVKELAEAQ